MRELKANYLVLGSLTPVTGKLKINIELVKARNNTARFSGDYKKGIGEMQLPGAEIAGNISENLTSWRYDGEKKMKDEFLTSK